MITGLILEGAQILDDGEGFGIDRSKYLNASTANSCIRKQWYERNLPEVEQDWGFARRGKQGELYLVDCLRAAGAMVDYVGDEQVSIVSEEYRISATPDGYIEEGDGWHALEFKTIDPRTNKARLPKADHVTQLQIGMELAHLQGDDFPKPVRGHLIYMDASNYNEIVEVQIDRDPGILDRLKHRAKAMLDAKKVDKLDREGKRTGECKLYGGCPFAEQCGVDGAAQTTASADLLADAVQQYTTAQADEAAAKRVKDDAAEQIRSQLTSMGVRQAVAGNHMVSLTETAGRTTVDWKAAEKAGVNLDAFKKIGKPSERLTVK